jgi:small subunit ribosomal protein S36
VAFAFGGWWYLANILRYGAIQPSVPGFPPGQFLGDDWQQFTSLATNSMLQRYWGSIGWFEVQMPFRYVYVAGGVAFVLVVLAVLGTRRPRGGRLAVLLMLWPTLASYGLVVEQALRYYERTHYYTGLSGRYVFVGFVGAAAAVGIGATRVPGLRRWAPLLLLAGARPRRSG